LTGSGAPRPSHTTSAAGLAAGFCAWGFLVAKLAAAAVVAAGGAGPIVLVAFPLGFAGDAVVVAVMLVASLLAARGPRWLQRATALGGLLLGLYAVLNVYLVAGYGSPLTAAMLTYRADADVASLWAREPLG
jgi:hypothetical protein